MKHIITILLLFLSINVFGQMPTFYNSDAPRKEKKGMNFNLDFGVSRGFSSFGNQDRGNIGFYCAIWRLEFELYFDNSDYKDLDYEGDSFYYNTYKTYAGTSYSLQRTNYSYWGSNGSKWGFIFNDYISAGIVFVTTIGGYREFNYTTHYWSTLHDGVTNYKYSGNGDFAFGSYVKLSYPIKIWKRPLVDWVLRPYASIQVTTNGNNFIALGTSIGLVVKD